VANALREASNPERFDGQTYDMMVNIGKNVVYHRHKFVGGLNMNDYGTQNSPGGGGGDLALTKAKVELMRGKGHSGWSTERTSNLE
jgi:hypothetical protein